MSEVAFRDPVYGDIRFTEPLLVELYVCDAVQRLCYIHQGGVTALIKPERRTTRLEHSRGAAALLRLLGASVVEQAAGLLHDVAHTAFSHVVDFVFPNQDHIYHEVHREEAIEASDLPGILARHGLDWRWVTDAENFSLLEQPLPLLCADRLDYFLRDAVVDFGTFDKKDAEALLQHLRPYGGQIIVDDVEAARWLGERFIELDDMCWCSVQEVGWYTVMARALRTALHHGIIGEGDFAGTDEDLWHRLKAAGNPDVDAWLSYLRRDVDFIRDPDSKGDGARLVVLPKVRTIDPPVLIGEQVVLLSTIDDAFARRRERYMAGKQGTWYLRIVADQ